jgi:uncharacterized RDD family membrane protein YckC
MSSEEDHRPGGPHRAYDERHVIDTPEQTQIEFTLAGVGSRALALMIDTLLQAAVVAVGFALTFLFWTRLVNSIRSAGMWLAAGLIVCGFVLYYGYFALFEIFWNGQTPGKRKIGIRVVKDSGRRLGPLETLARNLMRIVDQLPGFYAVGVLVALLNAQNRRLGDFVAGAIVVCERPSSAMRPDFYAEAAEIRIAGPLGAERLSDEEVVLIESFLQRRWELEAGIRWRLANEIFRRVQGKLMVSPNEDGIEHLLEAAIYERRGGR